MTAMSKHLLMKTSNPQLGSKTKFLGKLLIKTEREVQVKPFAKLFESIVQCWHGKLRSCANSRREIRVQSSERGTKAWDLLNTSSTVPSWES